jgi:hypothetical protein
MNLDVSRVTCFPVFPNNGDDAEECYDHEESSPKVDITG